MSTDSEAAATAQAVNGAAITQDETKQNPVAADSNDMNGATDTSAGPTDATKDEAVENGDTENKADDAAVSKPATDATGDEAKTPANSKKGKRQSTGPAESKGKKSKAGKATREFHLDAKPGDYFWANLKGHPPWPAIICDEDMLPEQIIASRPVTAKRADGSYREDVELGGKNQNDRTYPVMYLGTNEFSWMANWSLKPLDPTTLDVSEQGKKSKKLFEAYQVAVHNHPLQHWKDLLDQYQKENQEYEAEEAAKAEAKEKAKAKGSKGKRKSKAAADGDEDTLDVPEDDDAKTPKSSKKRKKAETGDAEENGKPAKTPKTSGVKLSLKTPNGTADSAAKASDKASTAKKTKKEKPAVNQTPEELHQSRSQSILFLRHKLQKGFLTRDQPPKEDEMDTMASWLSALEGQGDIEADIIRSSRIHKVLKGILKLENIPQEEKHNFKTRCTTVLDRLTKTLADNPEAAGESSKNGADEEKHDASAEDEKKDDKLPAEKKDDKPSAEKEDEPMPDADAVKTEQPVETTEADKGSAPEAETAEATPAGEEKSTDAT